MPRQSSSPEVVCPLAIFTWLVVPQTVGILARSSAEGQSKGPCNIVVHRRHGHPARGKAHQFVHDSLSEAALVERITVHTRPDISTWGQSERRHYSTAGKPRSSVRVGVTLKYVATVST